MSRASMARKDSQACSISEFFDLISDTRMQGGRVQVHGVPIVKVQSAGEKKSLGESPGQEQEVKRWSGSHCGEVKGDRSTRAGRREPKNGLSAAKRLKKSPRFDTRREPGTRETNKRKNVPAAVVKVPCLTREHEDDTAGWNQNDRTDFPNYIVMHWK